MNILVFVDIHASVSHAKMIVKKSRSADLLICAGDLSNFGHGLGKIGSLLAKTKKKILMVHGNHEIPADVGKLAKKFGCFVNIHKKAYRDGNVLIVGYGGGGFSYEDKFMERFFKKALKSVRPGDKVILVTHAPAYGKRTDYLQGTGHRGCISVNRGVKLLKPFCAIAGHLHETAGREDKIGKTIILNPGFAGRVLVI